MTEHNHKQPHTVAEYAGTVSRWCSLTGNTPDLDQGQSKTAAEFDTFNRYLDDLAAEKRRIAELEF